MQVPVEIHGKPPVIAFHPVYLVQAPEIGSTLYLSDELIPGICPPPQRPLLCAHADAGDDPGWNKRRKRGFATAPSSSRRLNHSPKNHPTHPGALQLNESKFSRLKLTRIFCIMDATASMQPGVIWGDSTH